jgi:hypothetical protein
MNMNIDMNMYMYIYIYLIMCHPKTRPRELRTHMMCLALKINGDGSMGSAASWSCIRLKYAQGSRRRVGRVHPMPCFQEVSGCFRVACSHPNGVHWEHLRMVSHSCRCPNSPMGAWAPYHIVKSCGVIFRSQSKPVKCDQFSQESNIHLWDRQILPFTVKPS